MATSLPINFAPFAHWRNKLLQVVLSQSSREIASEKEHMGETSKMSQQTPYAKGMQNIINSDGCLYGSGEIEFGYLEIPGIISNRTQAQVFRSGVSKTRRSGQPKGRNAVPATVSATPGIPVETILNAKPKPQSEARHKKEPKILYARSNSVAKMGSSTRKKYQTTQDTQQHERWSMATIDVDAVNEAAHGAALPDPLGKSSIFRYTVSTPDNIFQRSTATHGTTDFNQHKEMAANPVSPTPIQHDQILTPMELSLQDTSSSPSSSTLPKARSAEASSRSSSKSQSSRWSPSCQSSLKSLQNSVVSSIAAIDIQTDNPQRATPASIGGISPNSEQLNVGNHDNDPVSSGSSDGAISMGGSAMLTPTNNMETKSPINQAIQKPDRKTIIIDIGPYFIRAGILRNRPMEPDVIIPNVVSTISISETLVGETVLNEAISDPLSDVSKNLVFPLRQKNIKCPENIAILPTEKHILSEVLRRLEVKPKEYKVLISLPTRASSLRASLLEHLLEPASEADKKGGVSAVATVSAIRAALQTVKSTTCLLVSLSADLEIIPIVQGNTVEQGRVLLSLYGENAFNAMLRELVESGVELSREELIVYGLFIFQRAAFIKNHATVCNDIEVDLCEHPFCPSQRKIQITAETRMRASEGLMRPKQNPRFDPNIPSIRRLLRNALKSCHVEDRRRLCYNVILVGEFANLEGLRTRIEEEMRSFLPVTRLISRGPRVRVAPSAEEAAFDGACLLKAFMQGARAPNSHGLRFLASHDWSRIKERSIRNGNFDSARLVSLLNKDSVWS